MQDVLDRPFNPWSMKITIPENAATGRRGRDDRRRTKRPGDGGGGDGGGGREPGLVPHPGAGSSGPNWRYAYQEPVDATIEPDYPPPRRPEIDYPIIDAEVVEESVSPYGGGGETGPRGLRVLGSSQRRALPGPERPPHHPLAPMPPHLRPGSGVVAERRFR